MQKQFLNTGEVAAELGMSTYKVRRLCAQGKLPAINTSTTNRPFWTIRRCDLEDFLTPQSVAKKEKAERRQRRVDADVKRVF